MIKTLFFQYVIGAGFAGLLFLSACGRSTDEADPAALDNFLAQMQFEEEREKAEAIAEARAEEETRKRAAEERIIRYEQGRPATPRN